MGRDSWAKIAALRDGFDAKSQGEDFPITAQRAKFTEHIWSLDFVDPSNPRTPASDRTTTSTNEDEY